MRQNKEIETTGDSSCSDYGLARFPFNGNVPSVMDGIAQRKSRPKDPILRQKTATPCCLGFMPKPLKSRNREESKEKKRVDAQSTGARRARRNGRREPDGSNLRILTEPQLCSQFPARWRTCHSMKTNAMGLAAPPPNAARAIRRRASKPQFSPLRPR